MIMDIRSIFLVTLLVGFAYSIHPVRALTLPFFAVFDGFRCYFYECCSEPWIAPNITGLRDVLKEKVYGQHLVLGPVVSAIKGHVNNPNPNKNLALSFHGYTGVGKNYVSQMIANHLYKEGIHSQHVHMLISTLHFPHPHLIHLYQDQLRNWIRGNVTNCERSMFIFDEMDKMPEGLIDVIKPFLDYYPEIDGVNYRRTVFIFLSNTGGNAITEKTYEHWKKGLKREDITLKEMEDILVKHSFNEEGGLWHADLISKNLISMFVPFLPLEQKHVHDCVLDQFKQHNCYYKGMDVNHVMKEMLYFPAEEQLFSRSGCKKVQQKVEIHIEYFGLECGRTMHISHEL